LTGKPGSIELLPEVATWTSGLDPDAMAQAMERGIDYCLGRSDGELPADTRGYVDDYMEYSGLCVHVTHLRREQEHLEGQERELQARAETLAGGQVKGWGVREAKRHAARATSTAPAGGPTRDDTGPASASSPSVIPMVVAPGAGEEYMDQGPLRERLADLLEQTGWELDAAMRNVLTAAFALQRATTLPQGELTREKAQLGRRCATLRYRTWVLQQDNRIIEMHLAGLRARIARLQVLAPPPAAHDE